MLLAVALVMAHVPSPSVVKTDKGHLANLVPPGQVWAPDSQYCRDGYETALGYQLHVSCGPEDKTVRR